MGETGEQKLTIWGLRQNDGGRNNKVKKKYEKSKNKEGGNSREER